MAMYQQPFSAESHCCSPAVACGRSTPGPHGRMICGELGCAGWCRRESGRNRGNPWGCWAFQHSQGFPEGGRYWTRTSDPRLVRAESQVSRNRCCHWVSGRNTITPTVLPVPVNTHQHFRQSANADLMQTKYRPPSIAFQPVELLERDGRSLNSGLAAHIAGYGQGSPGP
jgi:hypothetical protein